jgi:hypothetical protein
MSTRNNEGGKAGVMQSIGDNNSLSGQTRTQVQVGRAS